MTFNKLGEKTAFFNKFIVSSILDELPVFHGIVRSFFISREEVGAFDFEDFLDRIKEVDRRDAAVFPPGGRILRCRNIR